MTISSRENPPNYWGKWISRIANSSLLGIVITVLLALLVGALCIKLIGADPLKAYQALLEGSFGNTNSFAETMVKTCPMILTGLALAVSMRIKLWNLGAEGQIYAGAILTGLVGIYINGLPPIIHIPLSLLAGCLGGAIWAFFPAILRARWKVNEILVFLMMNYIMTQLFNFVVDVAMRDRVSGINVSYQILHTAWLPVMVAKTRLHIGILLAVAAAIIIWVILNKTVLGYQIRVVGDNQRAARFAGIAVERTMVSAIMISGSLAGLAGAIEILGVQHRLLSDFSPGYGFMGMAVALLVNMHPLGVIPSAVFFSAMLNGADAMERWASVPFYMVTVIQGLVIIFSAVPVILRISKKRKAG